MLQNVPSLFPVHPEYSYIPLVEIPPAVLRKQALVMLLKQISADNGKKSFKMSPAYQVIVPMSFSSFFLAAPI